MFWVVGASVPGPASASHPQHDTLNEYERRQVPPTSLLAAPLHAASTPTSSFDYWWPYPPASTSISADDSDQTDAASFGGTELSISGASFTSSDTRISSGQMPTSSVYTTSAPDYSRSKSPLITITALPPLTSPWLHSHRVSAYRQPINPLVFIPLFSILGAGIGLLCGWYGYGYWKRRQQAQGADSLAGPRYKGIDSDDIEDDFKPFDAETYIHSNFGDGIDKDELSERPQEHRGVSCKQEDGDTLDQVGGHKTNSAWARAGLSVLRSPLLSGFMNGPTNSSSKLQACEKIHGEENGQLAGNLPNAPTVFSSVALSDEDDEYYEDARQAASKNGTMRHKSIRRRLAEKLQLQFNPRRVFGPQKSNMARKARGKTPELEEGVLLQDDSLLIRSPAASEKSSSKRNKAGPMPFVPGHGRAISDFSVLVNDIQTPPRVYALRDPGVSNTSVNASPGTRTYSTPLKSDNHSDIDDKYTPLPSRKVRSVRKLVSARSVRRRTEVMEDLDAPPKFSMPVDVDRRVLPTSPPLLSSPELESALFFSSSDLVRQCSSMSHPAMRGHSVYRAPPHYEPTSATRDSAKRRGSLGRRTSKKLLSKHSPSNGMDAWAMHIQPPNQSPAPLRRSTVRVSSSSPTKDGWKSRAMKQGREQSSTVPSVPTSSSPKDISEARCTALDKVDAIVERSWSARLLQGYASPTSPTMFGAHAERNDSIADARARGDYGG